VSAGAVGAAMDIEMLRAELARRFPAVDAREMRVARAPGRVNLIGEHTDYNLGFVMPAAISLETWLGFVPTDDRRVELASLQSDETGAFDLDAIAERTGSWIDYVAGTAWSMANEGIPTRGFRGVLTSSVPQGAGLSSSAALELASAWALGAEDPPHPDRMLVARVAQRAENGYVGVMCGLMDQFASSMGEAGRALLLDCRSLEYRPISLPAGHVLVALDTRSPHKLEASEYNARRAQCEAAVARLAEEDPSIRSLRDVDLGMLERLRGVLDEEALRRCEHVVRENERVLETERALAEGDLDAVAELFAASHRSLRDLYEVSSPELDALVEIARSVPGVRGSRMTGAGFGGCTVNLVEEASVDRLREAVEREYPARTGREPRVYVVQAAAGAGMVAA
jgi:galactokinase